MRPFYWVGTQETQDVGPNWHARCFGLSIFQPGCLGQTQTPLRRRRAGRSFGLGVTGAVLQWSTESANLPQVYHCRAHSTKFCLRADLRLGWGWLENRGQYNNKLLHSGVYSSHQGQRKTQWLTMQGPRVHKGIRNEPPEPPEPLKPKLKYSSRSMFQA